MKKTAPKVAASRNRRLTARVVAHIKAFEGKIVEGGSTKPLLCSNCFSDQGLKLDAFKIGTEDGSKCPQCRTPNGRKLNAELVGRLAHRFFVRGTIRRFDYGAAPAVQFNEYQQTSIKVSKWLKRDVSLIERAIRVGFFPYGPRAWMFGEVTPLKSLQKPAERHQVIGRILTEYPVRLLSKKETFFRLRKEPDDPRHHGEYDSPPATVAGKGRFDSAGFSVMYGSQDLEVCVHECRVTVDDELFVATLRPQHTLKCLDLTALIADGTTEFESIDMAVHMLFMAGPHSYEIARAIAIAARHAGFDGLIYPSYFSLVRTGAMPFATGYGISVRRFPSYVERARSYDVPNVAVFGRPIESGVVRVDCINRLVLSRVDYDIQFGPVEY